MELKEFEDLVDLHGEDLSQWPQALRGPAMGLMEKSNDARKIMEEAKQLRALMAGASMVSAPAGLTDRIMAQVKATGGKPEIALSRSPLASRYGDLGQAMRLALLLACFGFGIAIGLLDAVNADAGFNAETSSIFSDLLR